MTSAGSNKPDVGVVIVAGGAGTRAASDELKQFRWVAGEPMLLHSVRAFQRRADVGMVVCVLPRDRAGDPPPWLLQSDVDRLVVSVGGRERSDSVANGLEDLPEDLGIVVVHDAARPFVPDDVIDRVISEARKGRGAVAAIPVADTLKRVDDEGRIIETVPRREYWRAQTPQAFPRDQIIAAYRAARERGIGATDDATLCERIGFPVVVVPGSELSMKITEEADFGRAEALFRAVR